VGDVADVCEVEEVGVGTELEAGFSCAVDIEDWREDLNVAFAEDTGGAEGDGEEFGVGGGAVGGEDEAFCFGLRRGIC